MDANPANLCGGAYSGFLDVMLTSDCNANCSWCIERRGWNPAGHVHWRKLVKVINASPATDVCLLGGEPFVYPYLRELVAGIDKGKRIHITTNGLTLNSCVAKYVIAKLKPEDSVNISIHYYNFSGDACFKLSKKEVSPEGIKWLLGSGVSVRANCTCFREGIDTTSKMLTYILFIRSLGIKYIRFAELQDEGFEKYVDVYKCFFGGDMYGYAPFAEYEPFRDGCSLTYLYQGMNINLKMACGLINPWRVRPKDPVKHVNSLGVLYPDGVIYPDWRKKEPMKVSELLQLVAKGEISAALAEEMLKKINKPAKMAKDDVVETGDSCRVLPSSNCR